MQLQHVESVVKHVIKRNPVDVRAVYRQMGLFRNGKNQGDAGFIHV